MLFIGEKSQAAKLQRDGLARTYLPKRVAGRIDFLFGNFSQEFQCYVKIFRPHPARLASDGSKRIQQGCEILAYCRRDFQRYEDPHWSGPFGAWAWWFAAVVEKMQSHHVQRQLRRMPANRFAVSRKTHTAFFHSARVRKR